MVWRVKMKAGAGSQPGCALHGFHLALGVSDHSSLQLCQLRAVTLLPHESWWLEPSIVPNCSCPHVVGCCLLWTSPPCCSWCYPTLHPPLSLLVRVQVKSWIGAELNQGFRDQALTLVCYREAGRFLEPPFSSRKSCHGGWVWAAMGVKLCL